jgi:hypothetical protein
MENMRLIGIDKEMENFSKEVQNEMELLLFGENGLLNTLLYYPQGQCMNIGISMEYKNTIKKILEKLFEFQVIDISYIHNCGALQIRWGVCVSDDFHI